MQLVVHAFIREKFNRTRQIKSNTQFTWEFFLLFYFAFRNELHFMIRNNLNKRMLEEIAETRLSKRDFEKLNYA